MIRWGQPEYLLYVALLLPLAWFLWYRRKKERQALARLIATEQTTLLIPHLRPQRLVMRRVVWAMALGLGLLSLARPQWGFHWEEVRRRGLDIVVALDASKSMLAQDIKPNRLQQAKWAINDLLKLLRGDRVGLVTFAGGSFLQCPLTIDYAAFAMMLDDVYVGIIPQGGTAIQQALRTAMQAFEKSEGKADRVILLVTDGEDHEGEALTLVDELKKQDIHVYAIGIGTLEGELLPQFNEQGAMAPGFMKDRSGNVIKSSLKEDTLEQLALATEGVYVRATPTDFGLDKILEQGLKGLQRDQRESKMIKAWEDRFVWFLGLGLLLLIGEAVLHTAGWSEVKK